MLPVVATYTPAKTFQYTCFSLLSAILKTRGDVCIFFFASQYRSESRKSCTPWHAKNLLREGERSLGKLRPGARKTIYWRPRKLILKLDRIYFWKNFGSKKKQIFFNGKSMKIDFQIFGDFSDFRFWRFPLKKSDFFDPFFFSKIFSVQLKN